MSNIIVGTTAQSNWSDYNASTNPTVGWNLAQGYVWGNSAADTFTFANSTAYMGVAANQAVKFAGGGGADTLSFADLAIEETANLVSFNMSQLQHVTGQTWSVIGSGNTDMFNWTGAASPSIALIDGGAGNDTLNLSGSTVGRTINLYDAQFKSIEYLNGTSSSDILRGATNNETLAGGLGADQLWGGAGATDDLLIGGAGADTFWFSFYEGKDTISTEGTDSAADIVRLSGINFADLAFSVENGNDAVLNYKGTDGSYGNLTIDEWVSPLYPTNWGTADANRLNKFVADDKTFGLALANATSASLVGTTLSDYMLGGAGEDTLVAGADDSLYGGAGNDIFKYHASAAKFDGGANTAGGDTLTAAALTTGVELNMYDTAKFSNIEYVVGTSVADILRGSSKADTLAGGAGNDDLWGGDGQEIGDVLLGGAGADNFWFTFNQGSDTIAEEATKADSASDKVVLSGLNFANLTFGVADGNDAVINFKTSTGYNGNLTIDEWLTPAYVGGWGTANANRLNQFVTDDKTFGLALANATGATAMTGTTLSDFMLGGAGNDTITAGAGDSLYGGAGNDVLKFHASGAIFDGQVGDGDTLTAAALTAGVELNLYDTTKFNNIEYVLGTSLADILRGTTKSETLVGGSGADDLWGNEGSDWLSGGLGADNYWFQALDGSDTVTKDELNSSTDKAIFVGASFADLTFERINNATEDDLRISIGGDTLTSALVFEGWGLAGNTATGNSKRVNVFVTSDKTFGLAIGHTTTANTDLNGTSLADWVIGGSGNDSIKGSAGADTIYAKAGDDTIVYRSNYAIVDGGEGSDTLSASAATAGVEIDMRNVDATQSQFANIEFVEGSGYADILRGSSVAETLSGGAGADHLWGAAGNDYLIGGGGSDTYWFAGGDGNDTVEASVYNKFDTVNFATIDGKQIDGNDFSSVALSGEDLAISLTSGDSLTIQSWNNANTGNKLNVFNFGVNGNWSLTFTDGNPVWSQIV